MAKKIKTASGLIDVDFRIKTISGLIQVALHGKAGGGIVGYGGAPDPLLFARPASGLFYEASTTTATSYETLCFYRCGPTVPPSIIAKFGNFNGPAGSNVDTPVSNNLLVTAGFEILNGDFSPKVKSQILFGGSITTTMAGGVISVATSDAIDTSLMAAGDLFCIKTRLTAINGTDTITVPRHTSSYSPGTHGTFFMTLGEKVSLNAANRTMTNYNGSWSALAGGAIYRPIGVFAQTMPATQRSALVVGDSIGSPIAGYVNKILQTNDVPFLNLAKSGEMQSDWPLKSLGRAQTLYGRTAICEMGRNGVGTGTTSAINSLKALWAQLRAAGCVKVIQCTLGPQTTSTDGWMTTANQTGESNGFRIAQNIQIRALVGQSDGPDAVWDVEPVVSDTDITKWKAGYTGDGLHPNATAVAAIEAAASSGSWASQII